MIVLKLTTRDGRTYHVQPEDKLPISSVVNIKGISTVDNITPDMLDALRANEEPAPRAQFFGETS